MKDKERNKRLGQYFTEKELAKVLCELALKINPKISTAIDPMMGKGDMLTAINEIDSSILTYGIELDEQLNSKLPPGFKTNATVVFGNAFESKTFNKIGNKKFDLVITNPPYVRHLNQKLESKFDDFSVPSSHQVRNGLINALEENKMLGEDEKNFLVQIAKGYAGLSDLSVPSIIQCAALTKENGVLAIVIPESSITREYSIATLLVLFKLFEIKLIVKDESRQWFKNAQIKTLLLIGQKLEKPRKSLDSHPKISIVEISGATAASPLSDEIFANDYKLFASTFLDFNNSFKNSKHISQYFSSINSYLAPLITTNIVKKYPDLELITINNEDRAIELDARLRQYVGYTDFIKLIDLDVELNQGLRTGANNFFYYDLISEREKKSIVNFKFKDKCKEIEIPSSCLKPVLRKQKELTAQYFISASKLRGRLLVLNNHYTSFDIQKFAFDSEDVKKLSKEVSEHIFDCETLNIGTKDSPKYFPNLSAVKTNISEKHKIKKTWYQLPELRKRHIPDICIPRVNSRLVTAYMVENNVVVDANFLTINLKRDSIISSYALTSILNSDWIKLQLELSGNILGGGALKLDRNHLFNLVLPKFTTTELAQLDKLGKCLIDASKYEFAFTEINNLINSILKIQDKTILTTLLDNRLKTRSQNG
jgi:hypothetical protein